MFVRLAYELSLGHAKIEQVARRGWDTIYSAFLHCRSVLPLKSQSFDRKSRSVGDKA